MLSNKNYEADNGSGEAFAKDRIMSNGGTELMNNLGTVKKTMTTIIAEVTRYPIDILEVDANFEDDLGIDSVKRGEILLAVTKHYDLPEAFQEKAESFTSIATSAFAINDYLVNNQSDVAGTSSVATESDVTHAVGSSNEVDTVAHDLDAVKAAMTTIIAEVTRYPIDILEVNANFEDDLGIDSVKRGEILLAVTKHYDLPEAFQEKAESFTSIATSSAAISDYLANNQEHAATSAPATASVINEPEVANIVVSSDDTSVGEHDFNAVKAAMTTIIAEVTRYPIDILEVDANFEDDLGIDSVKRGEILLAVTKHYDLPEAFQEKAESFTSIAASVAAISDYLTNNLSHVGAPSVINDSSVTQTTISNNEAVAVAHDLDTVKSAMTTIIAEVTRYPIDILEVDANFEDDLGIDSVKRGEILLAVTKHYDLPEAFQEKAESFTSIATSAAAISDYLGSSNQSHIVTAQAAVNEPVMEAEPKPVSQVSQATVVENLVPQDAYPPRDDHGQPNYLKELTSIFSTQKSLPFAGKAALVTGSGRGIGKDIALSLSKLGAKIYVNAFHSRQQGEEVTQLIKDNGGEAHFIWGSVANAKHRQQIFEEIEQQGGLDFFISNASNGLIGHFDQINDEHWSKGFETNLVGLHQCSLLAAPLMAKRGGGQIITLSTPVSHRHVEDFACMAAIKASVESLTRSMAVEYEKYGVTVNCVSASAVYGDLIKRFPDSENAIKYWEEKSIGNRLIYPQEICNFINFLLSGAAQAINGSVLVIDGGISIRL